MNIFSIILLVLVSTTSSSVLKAKRATFPTRTYTSRTTTPRKTFRTCTYTKKTPYAGMGKKSKQNGLIKSKPITGHAKKTKRGYTYVNPYARSK